MSMHAGFSPCLYLFVCLFVFGGGFVGFFWFFFRILNFLFDFSRGSQRNIQHVLETLHGAVFSAAQLSGEVAVTARSNKAAGC